MSSILKALQRYAGVADTGRSEGYIDIGVQKNLTIVEAQT